MGKETRFGLAVIGILMAVLSYVVYRKIDRPSSGALAENRSSNGGDESSKEGDPGETPQMPDDEDADPRMADDGSGDPADDASAEDDPASTENGADASSLAEDEEQDGASDDTLLSKLSTRRTTLTPTNGRRPGAGGFSGGAASTEADPEVTGDDPSGTDTESDRPTTDSDDKAGTVADRDDAPAAESSDDEDSVVSSGAEDETTDDSEAVAATPRARYPNRGSARSAITPADEEDVSDEAPPGDDAAVDDLAARDDARPSDDELAADDATTEGALNEGPSDEGSSDERTSDEGSWAEKDPPARANPLDRRRTAASEPPPEETDDVSSEEDYGDDEAMVDAEDPAAADERDGDLAADESYDEAPSEDPSNDPGEEDVDETASGRGSGRVAAARRGSSTLRGRTGEYDPAKAIDLPPSMNDRRGDDAAEDDRTAARGSSTRRNTAPDRRASSTAADDEGDEERRYIVKPGDNFWLISQKVFGSGAYFRAIFAHNQDRLPNGERLTAGTELLIPSAEELQRLYPEAAPKTLASSRSVPRREVEDEAAADTDEPAEEAEEPRTPPRGRMRSALTRPPEEVAEESVNEEPRSPPAVARTRTTPSGPRGSLTPPSGRFPDGSPVDASTTSVAPPRNDDPTRHVVVKGETLFDIARQRLGSAALWTEIYDLNREAIGEDVRNIKPGTELILPARRGATEAKSPRKYSRR